jgi:hypothetical protein
VVDKKKQIDSNLLGFCLLVFKVRDIEERSAKERRRQGEQTGEERV